MGMIDKIQSGIEKLTNDDKRMNAAEIVTIQQAYNAMQLGIVKVEWYLTQTKNGELKEVLTDLRDDFLKAYVEKPRRILEKSGIPGYTMSLDQRVAGLPKTGAVVFTDEEILLDTVLSLQATITGLQAGALTAVRGDVRDFFLTARDAAFDQWRKVGVVTYRMAPQLIPPTMSGVQP